MNSTRLDAASSCASQHHGMMQLLLAEQERDGRKKIVAGSIFLMFGQTVSYAFNGARFEDFSLRPNDVILWHAINEAQRKGFHYLDFGEVAEEHSQLAAFKSKWGSEPIRLYRYYYPAPQRLLAIVTFQPTHLRRSPGTLGLQCRLGENPKWKFW